MVLSRYFKMAFELEFSMSLYQRTMFKDLTFVHGQKNCDFFKPILSLI